MVAAFCGHCGVKSEAEESFCVACGAALRRGAIETVEAKSDERTLLQHALKLLSSGQVPLAKGEIERLLEARPAWAVARAYLGIAYLRLNVVGNAREACERAVAEAPESFICHSKYAEVLARLGFYDQAMHQCDLALSGPSPDTASEMAARELREFCKEKGKGLFYRQVAPPSRLRLRNLVSRRPVPAGHPTPTSERGS